jgi:hypothetical protein
MPRFFTYSLSYKDEEEFRTEIKKPTLQVRTLKLHIIIIIIIIIIISSSSSSSSTLFFAMTCYLSSTDSVDTN